MTFYATSKAFCERCGTWVKGSAAAHKRQKPVGRIRGDVVSVEVVYCGPRCEREDTPTP